MFHELNLADRYSGKLIQIIETTTEWQKLHGFESAPIHQDFFKDSELEPLLSKYTTSSFILKMQPKSFYGWHTDMKRKCSINMLIAGLEGTCYFGEVENEYIFKNIYPLNYTPRRFYLFNTQIHHSVINLNSYRYILSIGFYGDSVNYNSVLEECKLLNLLN